MFLKQKVRNRKKKWQHRAKVDPFANCGVKCSQPSVFLLRALLYSRVAHSARESDWLFPIGTSREVIVCAWIALIGRQIRELTRKIVISRSGMQLCSLLQENWPSFKLRYAQTFFLEIYVYKHTRHIKVFCFITSVRVVLTDVNHRVILLEP